MEQIIGKYDNDYEGCGLCPYCGSALYWNDMPSNLNPQCCDNEDCKMNYLFEEEE